MILMLAVLCASVLQDGEIDRWIKGLGADAPADREEAVRRVRSIGEAARAALRTAAEAGDPDAGSLARGLLAELDTATRRRRWLGPTWTVTLPEKEHRVGDLPDLLREQVPCALRLPEGAAEARVRIGADGLPVWLFLDRFARAHGGLAVPPLPPPGGLALVEGRPGAAPDCVSGPFRIVLDRLTEETWEREGVPVRTLSAVLTLSWQPNVFPLWTLYNPVAVAGVESEDAGGNQRQEVSAHYSPRFPWINRISPEGWKTRILVPSPPRGTRTLRVLRGRILLRFADRLETVEFAAPSGRGEQEAKVGTIVVRLRDCERTSAGVTAAFEFGTPRKDAKGSGRRTLALLSEHAGMATELREAGGRSHPFQFRQGGSPWKAEEETAGFSGYFPALGVVESIRVPLLLESYEHAVDFEFRNVELP